MPTSARINTAARQRGAAKLAAIFAAVLLAAAGAWLALAPAAKMPDTTFTSIEEIGRAHV